MSGPRSTVAWQQARLRVLAEESACHICGGTLFVARSKHPQSRSVDHVVPLVLGGSLLDRRNLRLAHYGCNSSRGAKAPRPSRSEDW